MIIIRLRGGLGNQMFQYAAGRARAFASGQDLALDLSWFETGGKQTPRREYDLGIFAIQPTFATRLQSIWAKLTGRYMDGFFQSEDHFREAADLMRQDFRFAKDIPPASRDLQARIEREHSVCINVRRTDFVTGGIFVGIDYYLKAVQEILRRDPQATFFVFSDDIEWCRANLASIPAVTFVGHEHAGERFGAYLQLMTRCQHFIIPNSTFGWWAAWLATRPGKVVIASGGWQRAPGETGDPVPSGWMQM